MAFPSPADEHLEKPLDLHEHVVQHPQATFFFRNEGSSMQADGLFHDDILVVDRFLKPGPGSIIVAILDGRFLLRRLVRSGIDWRLEASDPRVPAIQIREESDFEIWGVVTYSVHKAS